MKEIKAVIQPFMLENVLDVLSDYGELPGLTISEVLGWGKTRGADEGDTHQESGHAFAKKTKLEIVLSDDTTETVVDLIALATKTGRPGDGKIFIYDVTDVVKIRTGKRGAEAV
jgi:nitrogen regulatory protein P-II 1